MKNEILRMEQVTTIENDATLLDQFNLHIFRGEIMGLVCLNETGEESLIDLICRNAPIHYGRVYFNETLVNSYRHSPMTRNRAAVIEQRSRLVGDLTVADNIFILRPGIKKYLIHPRTLKEQLKRITAGLGIHLDGGELAADLSPYEKCTVELLRAVIMGAKLIVIRDISNFVSAADLVKFHGHLRHFCGKGFSFLYVCSHHEEAFKICGHVALMRDGKIRKVLDPTEYSKENMVPFYIGEFADILGKAKAGRAGGEILAFHDVCTENMDHLSFSVASGECVVLLDISNTVLRDIMNLMSGQLRRKSGEIDYCGMPYTFRRARHAVSNGVVCIEEHPDRSMVFQGASYLDNLCFLIGEKRNRLPVGRRIKKYILKTYRPIVGDCIYEQDVTNLDLQSLCDLVYYRAELSRPRIIFCMQPFAGLDMYQRPHLIKLIEGLKKKNITVVMLAVNFADTLVVADQLILLKDGKFSCEYPREKFHLFSSEGITIP